MLHIYNKDAVLSRHAALYLHGVLFSHYAFFYQLFYAFIPCCIFIVSLRTIAVPLLHLPLTLPAISTLEARYWPLLLLFPTIVHHSCTKEPLLIYHESLISQVIQWIVLFYHFLRNILLVLLKSRESRVDDLKTSNSKQSPNIGSF